MRFHHMSALGPPYGPERFVGTVTLIVFHVTCVWRGLGSSTKELCPGRCSRAVQDI